MDIASKIYLLVIPWAMVAQSRSAQPWSERMAATKGPDSIHLAILLVWEKQKSGWKFLARQAVKI